MSSKAKAGQIVLNEHVNVLKELLKPIMDESADDDYKSIVKSILFKMSQVEKEIYNSLSPQEREEVLSTVTENKRDSITNKLDIDLKKANQLLGFPDSYQGDDKATGTVRGEAAVFGFLVMAYSCCNGSGSGVIFGVGVHSCGDRFIVAGCP